MMIPHRCRLIQTSFGVDRFRPPRWPVPPSRFAWAMAPIEFRLLPDSATVEADGSLSVGGCSLLELADRFGTPLFVYDVAHVRRRCREAVAAFGPRSGDLRHQGVPLPGHRPPRARGGVAVRRRQRRRAARRARRRGARRVMRDARQQQERRRATAGDHGWRAADRRRQLRRARSPRRPPRRGPCRLRTSCCVSRRASTLTPTRTSPPGRTIPSSASTSRNGDAERAGAAGAAVAVGEPGRLPLPHRVERVRRRQLRQSGGGDGRVRRRLRPPRARPRRRARRRLRRG